MNISIENIGKEQDKYLLSLKSGEEIWCTERKLQNIRAFSGGFPHGFIHPLAVLPGNFV